MAGKYGREATISNRDELLCFLSVSLEYLKMCGGTLCNAQGGRKSNALVSQDLREEDTTICRSQVGE